MNIPTSHNLPTQLLSSVFKKTTATYKFYWFLGLIECLENGNMIIDKKEIFARMICNAWFTINYFHLSFGVADKLQDAVKQLLIDENLTVNDDKNKLFSKLINSKKESTFKVLYHFDNNVPHWFLSPWFESCTKQEVYEKSKFYVNNCLYGLYKDEIHLNPNWKDYLLTNARILKDFIYWNLAIFLQNRNPNVPDIPNKLVKQITRNSLQNQYKNYWKLVFNELGSIKCIFTGNRLDVNSKNFALDHFIPYAFVSHDLIWNLIPIDKNFNIRKSDKLPQFNMYFDKFKNLQKIAFQIHATHNSKSKLIEDYLTIFPNISSFDEELLAQTIQPLITIAHNNGFKYLYE